MHDMNNNNSNKYYYKPYPPMPNNQHHRPHHQPNVFDNQRNDYQTHFNGPPGNMNSYMNMNNNMIPNSSYTHFSTSYPGAGNGQFYRDFRQNWQPPQVMPPQQHRPMPPTTTQHQQHSVSQAQTPVSHGQPPVSQGQPQQPSNIQSRPSFSTARNSRAADESQLAKLKQNLAVTQKELTRVTAEKMKLEVEEQRLQKIVEKTKSDIDKLDSRLRDPRVKNRPDSIAVSSSSSSLDNLNCDPSNSSMSCSSNFSTTSVPPLSLSSTQVNNLLTTSVPSCPAQNITTNNDLTYSLLTAPLPNNSLQQTSHSAPITPITSNNSLLVTNPITSISVPNSNNSGDQSNSSINGVPLIPFTSNDPRGPASLLAFNARNVTKTNPSRGKQLSNLVQFKSLPLIFDIFPDEVLKPEIYAQTLTKLKLPFSIKPTQMDQLNRNPTHRVLLRICLVKAKKTSQSDRVSRKLAIRINNRPFPLGKQTNGSIKAPLDITQYCTDIRNELELCWPENEPNRDYGVGIFINQRFTPDYSLKYLQTKDYQRPSSEALKMIAKNFATSGDICSDEIFVPLTCPITKKRLEIPAIGIKCEHLACFDAKSFLDINQKRSEWHCPSCKKAIGFNDLRIDCLITEILSKAPKDCLKVSFDVNGAWHPVIENKEKESTPTLIDVNKIDIITLDDSDEENLKGCDDPSEAPTNQAVVDDDDDQDEEDDDDDDDETEQDDDDDETEQDDDDDEEDEEDEEEEEEEEEGEITDRDGSVNCNRSERSRRYEDDPDFYPGTGSEKSRSPTEPPLSNGSSQLNDSELDEEIIPPSSSRERKKKQLFEIFGSDADSRENSPESPKNTSVSRGRKRRRDRSARSSTRKGRRH